MRAFQQELSLVRTATDESYLTEEYQSVPLSIAHVWYGFAALARYF